MSGLLSSSNTYPSRGDNKRAILDLIRFTPGGISRAELARQKGLSRSAVTAIINELMDDELVWEAESGTASTGRRPILLELNSQRGYVLGVDMGATHLGLLLADLGAHVVVEKETAFDIRQGPEVCLSQVDRQIRSLLTEAGILFSNILTVGVGVPGPVVGGGTMVLSPPIMPGWDQYPIQLHLQELWGCPVSINNDAELGAIGEWAYGAGRDEKNLVYVKVGSGVGAGLILNDSIYRGEAGTAGEIGHVTIQDQGPLCSCGNRGCLEALAGGRAIAQQAQAAVRAGQRTLLSTVKPVEKISARDVTQAARRGDLVAQQIVSTAGMYLGTAIAGLINVLNPGIVVIGGGVAQSGDLLLESLRISARERSLKAAGQAVRITSAVLGRRSSSMGAVVQAITIVLDKCTATTSSPSSDASSDWVPSLDKRRRVDPELEPPELDE